MPVGSLVGKPSPTTVAPSHDDRAQVSPSSASASGSLGEVTPKRFGLNYDPPAIILEYLQTDTGKLFHRRIALQRLRRNADASQVAEKLRQKNEVLLAEEKVSFEQLVSLVQKLQAKMPESVAAASEEARRTREAKTNSRHRKADLTIHVRCLSGDCKTLRLSGTDSISQAKLAIQREMGTAFEQQELVLDKVTLSENDRSLQSYGITDGSELNLVALDYDVVDLNKLSDEELNQHKARMDVQFLKNQRKPGDPDFVYDVQVDFEPDDNAPCGWDSDSAGSDA
mmetsp:Transcript_53845/g.125862  ORF Transcript_53845/g.125862 Transcript_53845/m.125862 type:complete len:283 (-) Transcript_53845:29-877(-)